MARHEYDVCAVVISDLSTDARVWKEIRSLEDSVGRRKLIGCAYNLKRVRRRMEDGVEVCEVPLGRRGGRVMLVGRARTLIRVWLELFRTRARVYHCHNVHPGLAAVVASRVWRSRLVYDGHELYGESPPGAGRLARLGGRLNRLGERLMVSRSDVVITTNPSRAAELERRYGRRDVQVLANVPPRVEQISPIDPGFPASARVLLYQGGIYAEGRAFRETLEALALLDEDIHFVILGFGRDASIRRIEQWAAEFGVAHRVKLLGPRPFADLVHTAAPAAVGLVPLKPNTLNQITGDTNKLHEYLMAGLPVVGSDLPEIRRVLCEGDPPPGELFDPASPASIANAVRRVLDDPRYEARRRTARSLALARHNWNGEERRLKGIYQQLVAS